MKFLSIFYRIRKSVLLIVPLLLLGSYAVHEAAGHAAGITGYSRAGCGGGGCHGTKSSATVISISTDSTQIIAGQTYIFRISIANPNESGAGCDISVDKGAKLQTDGGYASGLQPLGNDLTHTGPRQFTGDSAVWTFKYKAPSTAGIAHIYAAGNAVNLDGSADAQDHWNLAVDTLTIVPASSVTTTTNFSADIQIFPNPSTTGRLTLASSGIDGSARIAVSDPAGKVVMRESLMLGSGNILDLSTLPNGTYFLSIQARNGQSFVKQVVLQR